MEPIEFVGFPSLATAVPFRRNFLPANIHPKPASRASASSFFFGSYLPRCVRRTRCKGAGRRRKKSHRRLQSPPSPKKKNFWYSIVNKSRNGKKKHNSRPAQYIIISIKRQQETRDSLLPTHNNISGCFLFSSYCYRDGARHQLRLLVAY